RREAGGGGDRVDGPLARRAQLGDEGLDLPAGGARPRTDQPAGGGRGEVPVDEVAAADVVPVGRVVVRGHGGGGGGAHAPTVCGAAGRARARCARPWPAATRGRARAGLRSAAAAGELGHDLVEARA